MDWAVRATVLFLFSAIVAQSIEHGGADKKVVCYYTNWSVYRPGIAKFSPQNINPYLCTHLIYAFGGFTKDNTLKPFDKYEDIEKGGYAKFNGLKTYNKNLKTMLAIGGWNEGSSRFSPMVADAGKRREFVKNSVKFLRQNHFDGLDLDWEYPAFREGGKPQDKENYANLVQELREEFERESAKTGRPRLLLSMAVPAGTEYIDKGYDVPRLNEYLDFINLLSYDYHSAFEPAVNHHAPLRPLEEDNEYNYDSELTIEHSVNHLIKSGASAEKIILGIPTYGRSYTLFNEDSTDLGSPADGPGEKGEATREKGYLAYYEICEALMNSNDWQMVQPNPNAMGPYAFKGNQWVGYDDENIVRLKARYVNENNLGGIMIWSIDNDDFRGKCHGRAYPLIEAAKEALLLGETKSTVQKTKSPLSRKKNRNHGSQSNSGGGGNSNFLNRNGGSNGRRGSATTSVPVTSKRTSPVRSKYRPLVRSKVKEEDDDENREVTRRSYDRTSSREEENDGGNAVRTSDKGGRKGTRSRSKTRNRGNNTRRKKPSRPVEVSEEEDDDEEESKNESNLTIDDSSPSSSLSNRLTTPEPPTTPDPGADFKCEDEGFFPHPRDCKKYFWCLDSGPGGLGTVAHQFTCPSGLVFNKAADSCDYPRNVVCPKSKPSQSTVSTTRAPITAATSKTTYLHSTTPRTTTAKLEEEEEYEYYEDEDDIEDEEEEVEEEEEEEKKKEVKVTSTLKPLQYKTITRSKPATTTTTTTTTTTSKPGKVESDKLDETEDEEDPKVIKELINLIRKAGGIEQLEKQLRLQEKTPNVSSTSDSVTPATISRTLYERVLSRQAGKVIGNSRPTSYKNGPGKAQFEGLDEVPEVKSLRRTNKPQYVTIERPKTSTNAPPLNKNEEDEEEELDDDNANVASFEEETVHNPSEINTSTQRVTPSYVNIRRNRLSTTTSRNENDVEEKEEEAEQERPTRRRRPVASKKQEKESGSEITSKFRNRASNRNFDKSKKNAEENSHVEKEEKSNQRTRPVENESETTTTKSRYVSIQRFRSTTSKTVKEEEDEVDKSNSSIESSTTETSTTSSTSDSKINRIDESSTASTASPIATTPQSFFTSTSKIVSKAQTPKDSSTLNYQRDGPVPTTSFKVEQTSTATASVSEITNYTVNVSTDKTITEGSNDAPIVNYIRNASTTQSPSISRTENAEEVAALGSSTLAAMPTESFVKLVEDSATEILLTTAPASEISASTSSSKVLASVSQPRPFGFTRRRPSTVSSFSEATTTPLAPSADQSKSKVATLDAQRLPTLKELIGYQKSDFTTSSSVLLDLLPVDDTLEDLQTIENTNFLGNVDYASLRLPGTRKSKEISQVSQSIDETAANAEEDTEEYSKSRKRRTKIDETDGSTVTLTTTLRPTTMRGTPVSSSTEKSSTRGFYLTKAHIETSTINTTPDDFPPTTEINASDGSPTKERVLNERKNVEKQTRNVSKSEEYSTTEPSITGATDYAIHSSTRGPIRKTTLSADKTLLVKRTRNPVRYTVSSTPLWSGRRLRSRIRVTTESSTQKLKKQLADNYANQRRRARVYSSDETTTFNSDSIDNIEKDAAVIEATTRQIVATEPVTPGETTQIKIDDFTQDSTIGKFMKTTDSTIVENKGKDISSLNDTLNDSTVSVDTTPSITVLITENEKNSEEKDAATDVVKLSTISESENTVQDEKLTAQPFDFPTTKEVYTQDDFNEVTSNEEEQQFKMTTMLDTTPYENTKDLPQDEATVEKSKVTTTDSSHAYQTEAQTEATTLILEHITNTEIQSNFKEITSFSENTEVPIILQNSRSILASPSTIINEQSEDKMKNQQKQRIKVVSRNNESNERKKTNVHRRVLHRNFNEINADKSVSEENSRRHHPKLRVRVHRTRQRRPDNSVWLKTTSINDFPSEEIDNYSGRTKLVIAKKLKTDEPESEEETTTTTTMHVEETTVLISAEPSSSSPPSYQEHTERPENEATVSRTPGTPVRTLGSVTVNRLRKPNVSTISTSKTSSTTSSYRKTRPSETSLPPTTSPIDSESPGLESSDQNSRAQELAVTLADPPSTRTSSSNKGQQQQPSRDSSRRRISTTIAPRSTLTSLNGRNRQKKPSTEAKTSGQQSFSSISRTRKPPVVDYDYYEDEDERIVAKSTFNGKLSLTNKGAVRCLDQGNFPHPFSCKKFITCARMVNGEVIGAEYTCPDKLSFDPVGGICNWSAGLGCKE